MTRVFVAGFIDFHDPEEIIDYRLRFRNELEGHGYTPVDQYSEALELVRGIDLDEMGPVEMTSLLEDLPEEPYVRAVEQAVFETSIDRVLASPEIVPKHTPDELVERIVERDYELLESCEAVLAYLEKPSCGTMAEILRAERHDTPVVSVSESPPHYVQYHSTSVAGTLAEGVAELDRTLAD